jgi:WD40 repeat protein
MNVRRGFLVFAIIATIAPSRAAGERIYGTIVKIDEGAVTIKIDSQSIPNRGDKVEIGLGLPGLDFFDTKALGTVQAVTGERVVVKVFSSFDTIDETDVARIISERPTTPGHNQPKLLLTGTLSVAEVRRFNEGSGSAAFSPDGRMVVSGGTGYAVRNGQWTNIGPNLVLWDLDSGREVHRFLGVNGTISSVVFSPNGKQIASAGENDTIRLWDAESGLQVRTFTVPPDADDSANTMLAFSPDGRRLASCAESGVYIHLWDVETGEQFRNIHAGVGATYFSAILFTPDGQRVITPAPNGISIWSVESGREIRRIYRKDRKQLGAQCGAISRDGRMLATGDSNRPGDAWLWDIDPAKDNRVSPGWEFVAEIRRFAHPKAVRRIALSSDGALLLTAGSPRSDPSQPEPLGGTSRGDAIVRLWDIHSGKQLLEFQPRVGQGEVYGDDISTNGLEFSPDGQKILVTGNHAVCVWALGSEQSVPEKTQE